MLKGMVSNRALYDFLSKGCAGTVKAVFSGGVYLDFSGKVIMLHAAENGFVPFGIAVSEFKGKGKAFGIEAEMKVFAKDNLLECQETGFKIAFAFNEEVPEPVDESAFSSFAKKFEEYSELAQRSCLSIYSACDFEGINRENIEDLFARVAYTGLVELVKAMDNEGTEMQFCSALEKLLGLGRGLTPSMDDFLCGMLFTLHYARRSIDIKLNWLGDFCAAVKKISPLRTNAYSAAYLLSAAEGEDFSAMLKCIETASDDRFGCNIERLIDIGSSSGADMFCGMLFAANYIMKQRQVTV